MIFLAHALLGTLIGKSFSNLLLIAVLAFISHFILDALPHLDTGSFKKSRDENTLRDWLFILFDVLVGVAFVIYFALKLASWPIIVGGFFAVLPDVIDGFAWLFKLERKPFFKQFHLWHEQIGFKLTYDLVWLGLFVEIFVILVLLAVLWF